jgi:CRP-like cAMP-binding protein
VANGANTLDVGAAVRRNRVLASLECADFALIEGQLEPVELKLRQRLEAANRPIKYVYFVEAGIASVVAVGPGGSRPAEVGLMGPEGMTGTAIILGGSRSPNETFVQAEGSGTRIAVDALRSAMARSAKLTGRLLCYVHCFLVQAAHTARASAEGTIESRLARWLLMARDRLDRDDLHITHEFLALMLGVRRAGVTGALDKFAADGLLQCERRHITIVDVAELRSRAGDLYGIPETELDRLLPKAT